MNSCSEKRKQPTQSNKKSLINRVGRIEGQVRGIKGMLEGDKYCIDILTQISAAEKALSALAREILIEHISSCVVNGIKNGDDEIIAELNNTINKLF